MSLHSCPACHRSRTIYLILLVLACAPGSFAEKRTDLTKTQQLRLVEVKEPNGQILSYGHLASSTEVRLRGTRRAPNARIKLKVGSRPGFVELDINRGGISGLKPAHSLGKDYLTYVLWAVSVDGKASNLGEITFQGDNPVPVNLTTPYQTFWLMVTAEPNYAVVDPSQEVVLYSVKDGSDNEKNAIAINRPLFFFTHYATYQSAASGRVPDVPNQLLQARKAVELASNSGLLAADVPGTLDVKEQEYAHEALTQARTFLTRAENAYRKDRSADEVIQFARTAAQSAENARALASGAVGGLMVHQMERELTDLRSEVARLRGNAPSDVGASASASASAPASAAAATPLPQSSVTARIVSLATQPALWFAMAGWGLAIALLSRRRTI
jgi:hypothetical protein